MTLDGPPLLAAIVEGTTDAVFVKDLEGRYLMVNSACARILGRPKEEIVGKDDAQLLPPETAGPLAEVDRRVMDTGKASSYEEVLPVAGRPRTYLSTKSVHRDDAGNALGIIGISRDITERKRAEQELKRREEQFRSLAEGVDFIPWEADAATWRFTYVGPQAVEILDYPSEDWYRDGFWVDRIHPEDREWVAVYCAASSASSQRYRFEYRMLDSDGRVVWLDDIVSVVEGEDGTKRLQGVMVDITERKRAEEQLRSSRDQLEAILRGVADGITAQDSSGRVIYANERAARLVGYPSAQEFLEAPPQEVLDRFEIMDRSGQPFPLDRLPGRRALRGESAPEELLCFRATATDERRWSVVRAMPIFDERGEVSLAVNILRDVTQSRRAEEERARLAAIVKSSNDAIIGKTLEGIITSWNPGAQKIYGYSAEEAVGRPITMLAPSEVSDEIPTILEGVRQGKVVVHYETVRLTKDGRRIDVSLTVSPIRGSEGEIVGASTIARDITERKRAEEAELEVREAERSRLARDLHDGALQDLSLVVQQLEAKRVEAEIEGLDTGLDQDVERLRQAVRGLREALYDLRQAGDVPFFEQVEDMVRHYRELTPEGEIALVAEEGFPSELPERMTTQLVRLVREALTNARQHSAARHVRVTLGASEGGLVVEVADDGRGFVAGTTGGGMGLSTMRERAALLGGTLEVWSEPGQGTRVCLRLARPDDAP